MVTTDVIREFRLLLRDFFDAQIEDWGDDANAPRFARIEAFLDEHEDSHDELAELFLFAFVDLRDGLFELIELVGAPLDPVGLAQEIDELGRRRPRELRAGKVRSLHASLQTAIDTAQG
jgi:hypothetical protein